MEEDGLPEGFELLDSYLRRMWSLKESKAGEDGFLTPDECLNLVGQLESILAQDNELRDFCCRLSRVFPLIRDEVLMCPTDSRMEGVMKQGFRTLADWLLLEMLFSPSSLAVVLTRIWWQPTPFWLERRELSGRARKLVQRFAEEN